MKKIILLLFVILIFGTACNRSSQEEAINMNEVLKIKTWLLDEELEGTGRWGYIDRSTRKYPRVADGDGYWIPNDGTAKIENEDVFVYEALEVGKPRTMAPLGMHMTRSYGNNIGYMNLNLDIDFNGYVEVEKVEPSDSSIRLFFSYKKNGNPVILEELKMNAPTTVNVYPVGKVLVSEGTAGLLAATDTIVDKEYTIRIRAYMPDGTPAITAEIKLTAIPDPEYPWQTVHEGEYGEFYSMDEERTRFCMIELVSYTYSDMYIMRGEAG